MPDREKVACSLLESLLAARLIGFGDYYVARAMGLAAGEAHAWPQLALALTCRGLASGLVCIEPNDALSRIRADYVEVYREFVFAADFEKQVRPSDDSDYAFNKTLTDPDALPWPQVPNWIEVVLASDLVRTETENSRVSPLVWSGGYLYLDRYFRYQLQLAEDLKSRANLAIVSNDASNSQSSRLGIDLDSIKPEFDRLFPVSKSPKNESTMVDRQRLAASMALIHRLTVITGGPGTGKTTIAAKILHLLAFSTSSNAAGDRVRIALAAPTGKAAMRLQESLQESLCLLETSPASREFPREFPGHDSVLSAKTLHRLLRPNVDSGTSFYWNRDNPLPYDVVIVDEASMISLAMMAHLLAAMAPEARLILLGDKDQLASVEAGAVLGDLSLANVHVAPRFSSQFCEHLSTLLSEEEMKGIAKVTMHSLGRGNDEELVASSDDLPGISDCVVALNRYFRFDEGSSIGQFARSMTEIEDRVPERCTAQIDKIMDRIGHGSIQWIEPIESSQLSLRHRDEMLEGVVLQQMKAGYQPYLQALREVKKRSVDFERACRKVLESFSRFQVLCAHRRGPFGVESINRQIERSLFGAQSRWTLFDPWYIGRPILITENNYELELFNGDIGVVMPERSGSPKKVAMFFDSQGRLRTLALSRLPACETVFAMSIHKSQGSQFDRVMVCLPLQPSSILSRELVYTAVTRARNQVTLVAKREVLTHSLHCKVRRPSGLRRLLRVGEG